MTIVVVLKSGTKEVNFAELMSNPRSTVYTSPTRAQCSVLVFSTAESPNRARSDLPTTARSDLPTTKLG